MPIIEFPFEFEDFALQATIPGRLDIDGEINEGRITAIIAGYGNIESVVEIDGQAFLSAEISCLGSVLSDPDSWIPLKLSGPGVVGAGINGVGTFYAVLSYFEGRGYLPALASYAADRPVISGYSELPEFYGAAEGGAYIPPELTRGIGYIVSFASSGVITESNFSETYLNPLVSNGWLYTKNFDEAFTQPFYAEAVVSADGYVSGIASIDGIRADDYYAAITASAQVKTNITVDGVTYLSADAISAASCAGTLSVTHRLASSIQANGALIPDNDLGQSNPFENAIEGYGVIGPFWTYGAPGERLEAYCVSTLFAFNPFNYAVGSYIHNFDSTLLFTDQYIGTLASAIYTEILATQTMNTSSVFSGVVSSVSVFDSDLTLTSLQEAHKNFINQFNSTLSTTYTNSALIEQIIAFTSSLTVADVYEGIKAVLGSFFSTLSFDDAIAALADIQATFFSTLRNSDTYLPIVSTTAAPLVGSCATWVIDVDTQASVQYDRFSFNSYAQRGTEYLAAAEDGIYLLDGDTDAGADISALVDLAVSRFATPQRKYFPSVYLGVTSTGKMLLKAEVDGQTWIYEANNTTTNIANQRIDLGKGLVGSHWRFMLLNQDGLDFELESVEFLPFISSRRVY